MARNALGRGLGALIREQEVTPHAIPPNAPAGAATAAAPAPIAAGGPLQVDIDLIDPSPYQPRTRFAEVGLEELAQSIRSSGIIQPLVARKIGSRYQLIAGERRWRASQRAQLLRVPVVLREVSDEQALELTLVENIQREDLNPIEQARAFDRLMEESHLTQDEVASRTGKDRATVANSVRLLSLEEPLLEWIEEGKITAGHGRALLAIEDRKLRNELAQKASRGKLTVRQLERMATRRSRGHGLRAEAEAHDPNRQAALEELQKHIGTRVTLLMPTKGHAGQLILEFYDEEQLNGLYERLMN
ncbi:MAG TPA: ParB/RepB/Spo0J family partition protein [Candidatus Acidoferrum sp.]|jgi:ParB family chromosome partitioning protein|nr:ParB/RepB/Spo0J family partition protein [Candidatus Acidoferrum sp.]